VKVIVVSFEAGPMAQAYVTETGLKWPILIDRDRTLYHAYGMLRGSKWNVMGPRAMLAYARLLLRGRRMRRRAADHLQLGGDVLVDPEGIVRLHHVGNGPADRPAISKLLNVIVK